MVGDQQLLVNLMLVNAGNTESLADGIRIRYDNAYAVDISDDEQKLGNFGENLSSFREGTKLIIEKRPMISSRDTIFLKLSNTTKRDYRFQIGTFDFVQTNATAFLEDVWLNTLTPVDLTGTVNNIDFSVTSDPGSANPDRFRVVFALSGPLPVSFTSVKAIQQGNNIAVDWKVSNQLNINKYEVEKSTNGLNFMTANIQHATITNNGDAVYNWLDLNPVTGDNFYRIRSIGNSGEIKISQIVKVNMGKAKSGITIYPNPVLNGMIAVEFNDMQQGVYQLRLINNSGQVVDRQQLNFGGGTGTLPVSLPKNIAKGNYSLECIKPDNQRFMKELVIR